ncbi:hypothetical protein BCR39DRAFT_35392 [Naematelia encephala]|uniref:Wax synthase domain-containing protein n=1 Tax=Naematelia encephala TaxID=71784 RepID=A0A1Y2BM29_9TREE|nr:hypothetical protein BCR39DRAFT_35392 [Naematelia encephala]
MRFGFLQVTFYSSATRWAFSRSPPSLYPLPHPPPFPPARFLRRTTLFKSIDLLCNENRLINISPYSPPLKSSNISWFRYTTYHICMFSVHFLIYDMTTLPLALLAPDGVGDTFGGGGDYELFLGEMRHKYGVPELLSRMIWTLELGFTVYNGMAVMYHGFAMFSIGSGVWCGEEWPKLMDKPWLSTSLSELWGKRWHQTLRVSRHDTSLTES